MAHLGEVLSSNQTSIQEILVTHWHPDHIGGIPDVLKCVENPGILVMLISRSLSLFNSLMSITLGVLAQSPEPEAHDKVLGNNSDRIGIWKLIFGEN